MVKRKRREYEVDALFLVWMEASTDYESNIDESGFKDKRKGNTTIVDRTLNTASSMY